MSAKEFAEKHTLIYLENINFKWQRAANVGMMFITTSLLNQKGAS